MQKRTSLLLSIFLIIINLSCDISKDKENRNYQSEETHEVIKYKFKKNKTAKPAKNIILMLATGSGLSHIHAAHIANRGKLNIEQFTNQGLIRTDIAGKLIGDGAATTSCIATGQKIREGNLSIKNNHKLITLLEIFKKEGKSIGIVTTSDVTNSIIASFISHRNDKKEKIALDYLKIKPDILVGGGKNWFVNRNDSFPLIKKLRKVGYNLAFTEKKFRKIEKAPIIALLSEKDLPRFSDGRKYFLAQAVRKAIKLLSKNPKGYFLLIENSHIDWASHANDGNYAIEELLDFDRTLGEVLKYSRKESIIVVTSPHETGGMSIKEGSMRWGSVKASFSSEFHTANLTPVFVFGKNTTHFNGIYNNIDLFSKILKPCGIKTYK